MKKPLFFFTGGVVLLGLLVGCNTSGPPVPPPRSAAGVLSGPSVAGLPADSSVTAQTPATDPAYGYTPEKPIKVGGIHARRGPANERAFLASLRGPNGEPVRFERQGSCCPFPTPNGLMGNGLLDRYAVWIGDDPEPRILFVNMYDYERPLIPVGFTAASRAR